MVDSKHRIEDVDCVRAISQGDQKALLGRLLNYKRARKELTPSALYQQSKKGQRVDKETIRYFLARLGRLEGWRVNRKGALVSTDGHTIRHLIVRLKLALVAVNKECADPEPVAPPDGNQFAQLQLPPGLLAWGGTSQDGALSWLVTARGQPTKEQLLEAADHLATCASTL